MGSRKPIRYLATILGMTAMASLAAIPLAGVTAGTVAVASTARMTPADVNGGPLFRHTSSPKQGVFSCQSASRDQSGPCYGPAQIRRAYNIPSNLTGAGKTIVIIDAFGNPDIASDLALFDSTFDLPPANLNIICITGTCPTFDPTNADQVDWAGEIALDTQWSHADAPGATIDLVIARATRTRTSWPRSSTWSTTTSATCSRRASARARPAWSPASSRRSTRCS